MRIRSTLLACVLLSACGDDDDVGASGVAGDKKISALSLAELSELCNWVEVQEFTLPIRSECEGDAVFQTLTVAECEATRDTCIEEAPAERAEQMELGRTNCTGTVVAPREDCAATVAQLEDCVDDTMANARAFYGPLTCDEVNPDIDDHVPEPPSCALVNESCWP